MLAAFGPRVLGSDGALDRPALARLVFADPAVRRRLNEIVHPLVGQRSAALVAAAPPDAVVVQDVPLLAESGLASGFDLVVVVEAPEQARVGRLQRGRGLDAEQARARMAAQATDAQRRAIADVVLDNGGTPAGLAAQVDLLWRERIEPRLG